MRIAELFETRVEEKIDPVVKVAETADEGKLAAEIGSYVVTPSIERYIDDFIEHYTDTFLTKMTEIGVWISGYFGSGKSYLAKMMALLVENRMLEGVSACDRFAARIPADAPRRGSILRGLKRMDQCATRTLAFNLNALVDSKDRPLAAPLLSQYYQAQGYSSNLVYARVIEAELDRIGRLADLHDAVAARAKRPWEDVKQNPSFYSAHLYAAACQVAPEAFASPDDVRRALQEAERGELYNVDFLVGTILADLKQREKDEKKLQRLLLVLDESGQWIGNDKDRLAQLQALIEESAHQGQGKIWLIVTTHGDMGSVYREARALEPDMKKAEGRFRFKLPLTTENIGLVLENRLLRKKIAGRQELKSLYITHGGMLRGVGELANVSQTLPPCTEEKFPVYYPFLPYQVHLIPEIVKSLRSKGGRGEQMSGSTRTLLAITQDVLRAGRRPYLDEAVGALVSFDEIYANLAGEGEVSPDVRSDLARIRDAVPGATGLTLRVAEVLYLIRELAYIPRTRENVARLLVESVDEDLPTILARVDPELERLIKAKLVARIGEEYEFLTGERRTFEEEVSAVELEYKQQEREAGFRTHFVQEPGKSHWRNWLESNLVSYKGREFPVRLQIDQSAVSGTDGHVTLSLVSAFAALGGKTLDMLENDSLLPGEQYTIYFLSGRVRGFERDLTRYLATREVIERWKGDPHRSEEARRLALEREADDLPKLADRVVEGLKEGLRTGRVIFRGSSRALVVPAGQSPAAALHAEMAAFWPAIYTKFDRMPFRITNDQKAIQAVLAGESPLPADVIPLQLYDQAGNLNPASPLLDAIRIYLATEQDNKRRVLGDGLLKDFEAPPFGWDPNAVRVGVAALVRAGAVEVRINKKPYNNPADPELVDALRVSKTFNKVELILEEVEISPEVLTETRSFLIRLARRRNIDETTAALSEVAGGLAHAVLTKASTVQLWASGSGMPLPDSFIEGEEGWRKVLDLVKPVHRVQEIHGGRDALEVGFKAIEAHAIFQSRHAAQFTEMNRLKDDLDAIAHLLDPNSSLRAFLDEYEAATTVAGFADGETWKQLQSLKARALLELDPLLAGWRDEARRRLQAALDRLPEELVERELDPNLFDDLAAPLLALRDGLEQVTLPAQVAALPAQAN
ncbi:MAG: BREX system P-loop protein BrxC, partial [Chloroflexia bacterium]|nr:BREX system P-loop protein BrxC [Chloroflexia bacterium]